MVSMDEKGDKNREIDLNNNQYRRLTVMNDHAKGDIREMKKQDFMCLELTFNLDAYTANKILESKLKQASKLKTKSWFEEGVQLLPFKFTWCSHMIWLMTSNGHGHMQSTVERSGHRQARRRF